MKFTSKYFKDQRERLTFAAAVGSLGATSQDLQGLLKARCKDAALKLGVELLEQEVQGLCGEPYSRKPDNGYYRGGSEESSLIVDGGRVSFRRPRVRKDGKEAALQTLEKLRDQDLLDSEMHQRILKGVSTRDYSEVITGVADKTGISKSAVSRAFVRASQKSLDEINHGDLTRYRFVGLMIDGSEYDGKTIVGALGITTESQKIPLGIREGDTENHVVVKDLLAAILQRGFALASDRLLAVIDGGKALRKALLDVFGDRVLIQRCWIHKLRNLKSYTSQNIHGQIRWRLRKIMGLVSHTDAKRELHSMIEWLEGISHNAAQSLRECGEDLITAHLLQLPKEIRRTFGTTNPIESLLGVCRKRTRNVKNWGYHPKLKKKIPRDKILRWVASSMKAHEKKMRKIIGCKYMPALINALNKNKIEFTRKEA
jgi:transposase-like protein